LRISILIINENVDEAEKIKERLVSAYNDVECVTSIRDAVSRFVSMDFTLVILDANMSMEDDHKLLKVMRQAKRTPILLLSSQADHSERLRALRAGAHAYMGQPYSLEECLAQAEALMQLYIEAHPDSNLCYTLVFGKDLVIDPSTRQVFLKGKELNFTRKEFDLLFCLASNAGRVISREQLYEQVWSEDTAYDVDGLVKTHIKTLSDYGRGISFKRRNTINQKNISAETLIDAKEYCLTTKVYYYILNTRIPRRAGLFMKRIRLFSRQIISMLAVIVLILSLARCG